jgi:hypothetical protein
MIEKALEQHCLTLTQTRKHSVQNWRLEVDERLASLPSSMPFPANDFCIEWVYIIDLDREVFFCSSHVDGWDDCEDEVQYKLNEIPRQNAWYKRFTASGEDGSSDEEDTITAGIPEPMEVLDSALDFKKIGSPERYLETPRGSPDNSFLQSYRKLTPKLVTPKVLINLSSDFFHAHLMRHVVFEVFVRTYQSELPRVLTNFNAKDSAFRELVYAIISLASGTVLFQAKKQLINIDKNSRIDNENGYLVAKDSEGTENILPKFAKGFHSPGIEPGSAPSGELFWFNDVVICVTDGIEYTENLEAAIAKTVDFGQASGRTTFHGLIISLIDVVLIKHHSERVVERTVRIPIFKALRDHRDIVDAEQSQFLTSSDISSDPALNWKFPPPFSEQKPGFVAMMHLFDAAAMDCLKPSPPNAQRVPLEVCRLILEHVDDNTYLSCSRVSRNFRDYTLRNPRMGGHIIRQVSRPPPDALEFKMYDVLAKRDIEVTPMVTSSGQPIWLPVIGTPNKRPSILQGTPVYFPGLSVPHPFSLTEPTQEANRQEEESFDGFSWRKTGWGVNGGKFYPGSAQTASAWQNFIQRYTKLYDRDLSMVESHSHIYQLPPYTNVIYVRFVRDKSLFSVFTLWVKRLRDDSVEMRETVMKEAEDFLSKNSKGRGDVVGITFGYWIRFFEWVGGERETDLRLRARSERVWDMTVPEDEAEVLRIFEEIHAKEVARGPIVGFGGEDDSE